MMACLNDKIGIVRGGNVDDFFCNDALKFMRIFVLWTVLFVPPSLLKAQIEKIPVGQVVELSGNSSKLDSDNNLLPLENIYEKDKLKTFDSSLKVLMRDGSLIYLGPHSLFSIKKYGFSPGDVGQYYLAKGVLRMATFKSRKGQRYFLQTPSMKLSFRGTDFLLEVFPKRTIFQTDLVLVEGQMEVTFSKELGKRPFKLIGRDAIQFFHDGSGVLKRKPLRGKLLKNIIEKLKRPRHLGGKLFLYEVKNLIKRKKGLLSRASKKEKKRSPASLKTSKGRPFFLSHPSSFSLPQHLGDGEKKLYEDLSQKGLRELLRLKSIEDQNKRMRIKK